MSRATKRKHVTREVLEKFVVPTGDQSIVKVVSGRGNNLHEVEAPSGDHFLASMPTKFRKNVWIKRGDYVVVVPIAEGHKVQAEIVHILYPPQVKHLKEESLWPVAFEDKKNADGGTTTCPVDMRVPLPVIVGHGKVDSVADSTTTGTHPLEDDGFSEEEEEQEELFVNTNHPPPLDYGPSDTSSGSEQD